MTVDLSLTCRDVDSAVHRLVRLYEELAPEHLAGLGAYYAPDAYFKDPFNEVRGVPAITRIFEHMFASLQDPRFVVTQKLVQDDRAFLEWEFRFRLRRWRPEVEQCIRGASSLRFDAQGRVAHHRDYWDAAEELYEKLPLLGALMRWLRRTAFSSSKTGHAQGSPS
ncbi:nuclear transport factor 2 family protein [Comamonas sp. w2-DMI]|uniref:nuclear transport factor 2 family protein n=1 Tax=Comamonas sp. w2-DMI TaxID=3126391 RepID=UPI0032E50653